MGGTTYLQVFDLYKVALFFFVNEKLLFCFLIILI